MRQFFVPVVLTAALAAASGFASPPAAAAPPPAADLVETFSADPRRNLSWAFTSSWTWDAANGAVVSPTTASATARWAPGLYYTGTLVARVKLVSAPRGSKANASIVFAADPLTGAFRWVKLTAGAPGSVALGQTGTIGTGGTRVIKTVRRNVPLKTWLDLTVTVGIGGRVTVKLGTTTLFTVAAAPLASGRVGLAASRTKASFNSVVFRGNPDAEPCRECHAGQATPAPDVYRLWNGTWWDANMSGSPTVQQGGHGDPGGKPASTCTGTTGCHDLRQPTPGDHRNGILEPGERTTRNSYHLRAGFIDTTPSQAGDVQLTFDNYCFIACHRAAGVINHRHTTKSPYYVQFGHNLSDAEAGAVPAGFPLDHHLTSATSPTRPIFAPCVACHNPHGTDMPDTSKASNHMVRLRYSSTSELCGICHL